MAPKSGDAAPRKIAENRKAHYDYQILETLEAGIVLTGSEVKSLRATGANLLDSHCDYRAQGLVLLNMYIAEYKGANRFNHEPRRPRTLLLHKKEIRRLIGRMKTKGITLIPLSIYFNSGDLVKIELALAQGKKQYDKRQSEKQKDWDREKGRLLRKE